MLPPTLRIVHTHTPQSHLLFHPPAKGIRLKEMRLAGFLAIPGLASRGQSGPEAAEVHLEEAELLVLPQWQPAQDQRGCRRSLLFPSVVAIALLFIFGAASLHMPGTGTGVADITKLDQVLDKHPAAKPAKKIGKAADPGQTEDQTKDKLIQEIQQQDAEIHELHQEVTDRDVQIKSLKKEAESLRESLKAMEKKAKYALDLENVAGFFNSSSACDRPYCSDNVTKSHLMIQAKIDLLKKEQEESNSFLLKAHISFLDMRIWALEAEPVVGPVVFSVASLFIGGVMGLLFVGSCVLVALVLLIGRGVVKDSKNPFRAWYDGLRLFPETVVANFEATTASLLPLPIFLLCLIIGKIAGGAAANSIWILPVFFLPVFARAIYLERLAAQEAKEGFQILNLIFWTSKLELLDAVSDAATCASAFFVADAVEDRFVASFTHTSAILLPVVRLLGLPGLMTMALVFAVVSQLALSFLDANTDDEKRAYLEQAGLGLAASLKKQTTPGASFLSWALTLCRTIGENLPQLMLQGSLLMAHGESLLVQPLLLASMCLSLAIAAKKVVDVTAPLVAALLGLSCGDLSKTGCGGAVFLFVFGGFVSVMWLLFFFASFRVAMLQLCPCHVWGATTGCVALP